MRSALLGDVLLDDDAARNRITLPNPRLARITLDGGELLARQGSMAAYQGEIEFAFEGAGGLKRVLKKALSGEGVPLMRCRGTGELYLARNADELYVLELDGDSLSVNGANLLAFEPGLTWDIRKIDGATVVSGDVFNTVLSGHGRVVLSACGTPFLLDPAVAPTYADLQSAIAWSAGLRTRVVRTAGVGALLGRGSGEAFHLAFEGSGVVVVQSSEGPVVPKHDHKNVADWLA